jgi:hypothetical protein
MCNLSFMTKHGFSSVVNEFGEISEKFCHHFIQLIITHNFNNLLRFRDPNDEHKKWTHCLSNAWRDTGALKK